MKHFIPLSFLSAICALGTARGEAVPPRYVGPPLTPLHAVTNRAHVGISSLAVSPGGRLWATWYAGVTPSEDQNNYVILSTSADDGKTWKEVLIVDPDEGGPRRTFDPELWMAPDGTLRWSWTDRVMPYKNVKSDGLWMLTLADPESEPPKNLTPVRIAKGVMMCKPIVLSTGEWALPVATWYADPSSRMIVSADRGKTWLERGGATMPKADRLFDEHEFVERKDGSLWCLSRCKSGIREAVSSDRGKTWSPLEPSKIKHTSSRFFISRLASGNLLLVKHGPIGTQTGRSHLTAYVSKDDGATWAGGLLLDERNGVSYPDGQQVKNGLIYLTYDFDRTRSREILFATFREEDVLAGKAVSPDVRLRQLISKGSGGVPPAVPAVKPNKDGVALAAEGAGALDTSEWKSEPLKPGVKLFTDRDYTFSDGELPASFGKAFFARVPLSGKKTLRCTRPGVIGFLTPTGDRNKDSMSEALMAQGFRKVALPEIRLFAPQSTHNFCTFYQKTCQAGEVLSFGQWAVPVLLE